jgi:Leucine-rich repeat (LRR) protein
MLEIKTRVRKCRLENREEIDLSQLELSEFPEEIKELKSLVSLNLSENQIAFIPSWIKEMTELKYLDLSGNPIQRIPEEFSDWPVMINMGEKNVIKESEFSFDLQQKKFS